MAGSFKKILHEGHKDEADAHDVSNITDAKSATEISTEIDTDISTHGGVIDAHHAKYTNTEAENTVKTNVEVGQLKTPTTDLAMGSQKITGVGDATGPADVMAFGQRMTNEDVLAIGSAEGYVEIPKLGTEPQTPADGDLYYNTVTKSLEVYVAV